MDFFLKRSIMERDRAQVTDVPDMRGRTHVFANRVHAGRIMAEMLSSLRHEDAMVLAIPTGGVPVGIEIARRFAWPLELVIASKITPSWNPEVACGAVSFDGHATVGDEAEEWLGLDQGEIDEGIARARLRVRRRTQTLRGGLTELKFARRCVVLVDDGLATGYTMLAAVDAVRRAGVARIVVAVPTGHSQAVLRVSEEVDACYCANVRHGDAYAVAQAYQTWINLTEDDVAVMLEKFHAQAAG